MPTKLTLTYEELAAMIKEAKRHAVDIGAMCEPDGYSELSPEAVKVADDCWYKGMDNLETAILNWAYDYLNGHRPTNRPTETVS